MAERRIDAKAGPEMKRGGPYERAVAAVYRRVHHEPLVRQAVSGLRGAARLVGSWVRDSGGIGRGAAAAAVGVPWRQRATGSRASRGVRRAARVRSPGEAFVRELFRAIAEKGKSGYGQGASSERPGLAAAVRTGVHTRRRRLRAIGAVDVDLSEVKPAGDTGRHAAFDRLAALPRETRSLQAAAPARLAPQARAEEHPEGRPGL